MRCPFCDANKDEVVESRLVENGTCVRRRRECLKCHNRFTSYERISEHPLWVIKRNGEKEQYDREKLMSGILKACHKRKVALAAIEKMVGEVEKTLNRERGRITSSEKIGNVVLKKLRRLDPIAYIRFSSVYKEFGDLSEFAREIKELTLENREKNIKEKERQA